MEARAAGSGYAIRPGPAADNARVPAPGLELRAGLRALRPELGRAPRARGAATRGSPVPDEPNDPFRHDGLVVGRDDEPTRPSRRDGSRSPTSGSERSAGTSCRADDEGPRARRRGRGRARCQRGTPAEWAAGGGPREAGRSLAQAAAFGAIPLAGPSESG